MQFVLMPRFDCSTRSNINFNYIFAHPRAVVSGLSEDTTYDYVFGGPRSAVSHSTLKLTSPPVRLRPDGKFCKSYQCH